MEKLKIENGQKSFQIQDEIVPILQNINLTVQDGEFLAIVGHSGCGKSTLLKIIAGLQQFDEGIVEMDNKVITGPNTACGMIFQDHRLLPWLSIAENVTLGLGHLSKAERTEIAKKYLKLVGLEEFAQAYPKQLSGGMSQRTAIARALATKPEILLLDEPFGALDALTKIGLQKEVFEIHQKQKDTMILITHDIEEAVYLADRIVVMSTRPGRIRRIIDVDIAHPRNRSGNDFSYIKDMIYNEFFEAEKTYTDFVI